MMIREKAHMLSKKNSELTYFANVRVADNMCRLSEVGKQFFLDEYATSVLVLTPSELNELLNEARRQGRLEA